MITIALSVVFCCLAREYRETRTTLCRTLILLGFFVGYIVISLIFSTVTVVYAARHDILAKLLNFLEMVMAVILSVFQLIFPLGFLFYLYSYNLFRWRAIKRAAAEWRCFRSCCGREHAPREAATAPSSRRVPAPSVTFFDVPHSRMTTDVPNEEQIALLPNGGGGRGHGTIMNSWPNSSVLLFSLFLGRIWFLLKSLVRILCVCVCVIFTNNNKIHILSHNPVNTAYRTSLI